MLRRLLLLALAFGTFSATMHAQKEEPALSDAEVEILRDKAPIPPERVLAFLGFLEDRTKAIEKLTTIKRRAGRELDLHDLLEQFTSIANDLVDNLDEYSKRHRDLRKILPRVLSAAERYATAIKAPPDSEAYNVSRKLALEAVNDIRESASELIPEQKAYFLAHPPPKDDGRDTYSTVPR